MDWKTIKPGSMVVLESLITTVGQNISKIASLPSQKDLAEWLAKYKCTDVCMEFSGKYWIPTFNILEKTCFVITCSSKVCKTSKRE